MALISGAARSMGEVEARLFAAEGAQVVLGDVLVDEAKGVAADIGDAALAVSLDVTSEQDWAAAVDAAVSTFGHLDVLVNNAGILQTRPMMATSLDDYRKVIDVNQVGVFLGMKAATPAMVAGGGGSIVNISSILGLAGQVFSIAYAASKFAVRGMTKVAALELARTGIRVNSVHPGYIDTHMLSAANMGVNFSDVYDINTIPAGRMGTAQDVASLVLFLASDDSVYCSGAEI
ncbi:MAG: 3alpha(or 20beta)-hydroxysteroid dehydrogenase, partial [Actinomycetota bacterium]|nr:3alpha(or 20beta)-hydroxysteroid dehydrogenase [Actinomycetota bacterium]